MMSFGVKPQQVAFDDRRPAPVVRIPSLGKLAGRPAEVVQPGMVDEAARVVLQRSDDQCVERAGRICDVDDAALQGIADLEWRQRLGAAHIVDAQNAFAVLIDPADETLERPRIGGVLGECGDSLERHLLCGGGVRHQQRAYP